MDSNGPPTHGPPPPVRGGYRGRGGPPMRGFDRGRGRGMSRGGMMGMRGGMGGPPMMRGRGGMMRGGPPRGMGFQRGGPPRGGPPMRGGRPPMHAQRKFGDNFVEPNYENNETAPPQTQSQASEGATSATSPVPTTTSTSTAPPTTAAPQSVRGMPRGRGGPPNRGRGGYVSNTNGSGPGQDPSKMMGKPYRGVPRGGRGGYGQGLSRPPPSHSANTQVAPVPTLKRGAPTGPPGPKRGRYDQGPVNRQLIPKHQPQVQAVHPPPHNSYGASAPIQSHHTSYQSHDQMQHVDQYSHQAYNAPPPQTAYNGYGQSGYGASASSGYAQTTEYDQSQYSGYNTSGYGQQDTRYQGYTDYSQSYGAPAVDYTAPPPDYSQSQQYDDRSYGGYDAQAYSQSYANPSGYY